MDWRCQIEVEFKRAIWNIPEIKWKVGPTEDITIKRRNRREKQQSGWKVEWVRGRGTEGDNRSSHLIVHQLAALQTSRLTPAIMDCSLGGRQESHPVQSYSVPLFCSLVFQHTRPVNRQWTVIWWCALIDLLTHRGLRQGESWCTPGNVMLLLSCVCMSVGPVHYVQYEQSTYTLCVCVPLYSYLCEHQFLVIWDFHHGSEDIFRKWGLFWLGFRVRIRFRFRLELG